MTNFFLLSFEECNVEDGRVEVDKLKEIHFYYKTVIILGVSFVQLWGRVQ